MTLDFFKAMQLALGARFCHSYGDGGAIFYSFELGDFGLSDNGGELNIFGINRRIDLPSIPTSNANGDVGPLTAGYRVRCKMLGGEIDYSLNMDAELFSRAGDDYSPQDDGDPCAHCGLPVMYVSETATWHHLSDAVCFLSGPRPEAATG